LVRTQDEKLFSRRSLRAYNAHQSTTGANMSQVENQDGLEQSIRAGRLNAKMNFNQKVWALTSRIPAGSVTTYANIAHKLGTRAYRAVGQALHNNPYAPGVPCHRVVGSDGRLTGYAHGLPAKQKLLASEGVDVVRNRVKLSESMFNFR
jgi:methylated-DNA-[protein]-cysteine S-methyltransferase